MNIKEIRKMSDKELEKSLAEKRTLVKQVRFDITGSNSKNVKQGADAKRAVARMMTELQARNAK